MDELKSFDLAAYMSNAIRNIMKKAYKLDGLGCKMFIYVEYVPTESGTEHLALGEEKL